MAISNKELADLKEFAQCGYQKKIVSKNEYLNEKEKKQAIEAIEKIANILDKTFLEDSIEDGHPINYLINTALWTRQRLRELANMSTCKKSQMTPNEQEYVVNQMENNFFIPISTKLSSSSKEQSIQESFKQRYWKKLYIATAAIIAIAVTRDAEAISLGVHYSVEEKLPSQLVRILCPVPVKR